MIKLTLIILILCMRSIHGQLPGGGGSAAGRFPVGTMQNPAIHGGQQLGVGAGGRHGGRTPGTLSKLPPGFANVRGELMDISNKVIQRITAAGSNYYPYNNQNGPPIFKRREKDAGRRFVIFPDRNFPPGEGHFVVLRKMPGVMVPGIIPQPLYEVFRLSLGDSIHAFVQNYARSDQIGNVNHGGFNGLQGSNGAATSGFSTRKQQMMGRRKRKILQDELEIVDMAPVELDAVKNSLIQNDSSD